MSTVFDFKNINPPLSVLFKPMVDLRPDCVAHKNADVISPHLGRQVRIGSLLEISFCI